MVDAWPGTINVFAYRDGFTEEVESNKVSFQPEVGPPIERQRSAIGVRRYEWRGRGTTTEWAALKAFYRDTLFNGVLPFTRPDPLTGNNVTWKFVESPKLVQVRATFVVWSISVIKMP